MAPSASGVVRRVQAVPSHTIASVPAGEFASPPTAAQELAEVHDTALRTLLVGAAGFGVGWIAHVVPSHTSAKVKELKELSLAFPTVTQDCWVEQDTDSNPMDASPGGVGVDCDAQDAPFHIAASCPDRPKPIASQKVADTHDTEPSSENPAGLAAADQDVPSQMSVAALLPTATQDVADVLDTDSR